MGKTLSFVKGKGSLRHNNREFLAKNVDVERVSWNITYVKENLMDMYDRIFGEAVAEYNAKQKRNDRKIKNYLQEIKNSGNGEKTFYEIVVQIGRKGDTGVLDTDGKLSEDAKIASEILDQYAKEFQERNPNLILFNAVLHMDEATPHLHLDYIPVAHGYKNKMHTRNSLSKALQEMGIEPAKGQKDNETVHWQARERKYLTELCKERDIEIEVVGVDRDNYSIPEYKQAMREKEAAEAEIEILNSEKIEVEASLAELDEKLETGNVEITEQQEILEDIKDRIAAAEKRVDDKTKAMDKIIAAGKPVEKEIKEIQASVTDIPSLFGGEPMVKMPKKTFEKMISRYRVAGTFENLNEAYSRELSIKQSKLDKLTGQISELREKVSQLTKFIGLNGLTKAFEEFINQKSIKEKLKSKKKICEKKNRDNKPLEFDGKKKCDIAI